MTRVGIEKSVLLVHEELNKDNTDILDSIITARIRRIGEGTVFSLFVSPHLGGGIPQSGQGGTPSQVCLGVPHPRSGRGGTPSQVWLGDHIPGLAGE